MNSLDIRMVAPLAPLHADGSLNTALISRQADILRRRGAQGFYLCGGTGEGQLLTVAERKQIVETWRDILPADVPMIVHVGSGSPMDAIDLARHAQAIGASGVSSVTPSPYAARDMNALVAHFAAIAAAAPALPFYYYHNSASPGLKIKAVDFLAAAQKQIPTLGGIKYTDADLMDYSRALRFDGGRYAVLYGKDEMSLGALAMGARGFIGGSYNILSPLLRQVLQCWDDGLLDEARAAQDTLIDCIAIFGRYGGLSALKAASLELGLDLGPMRLPLPTVPVSNIPRLHADLDAVWPEWRETSAPSRIIEPSRNGVSAHS
ncbi:dihydrodipicolinate synthase family protein [Geminisphaera colitermitum]|uniref:dihydrodipicolinate synthase family protein n=1 Tax=Geminisphaera colitermitum TaxID=1148786 RepID=UPI000158D16B|nr:dihydrodipicolinate synthase family protein [Geminisphaera colitermitum]